MLTSINQQSMFPNNKSILIADVGTSILFAGTSFCVVITLASLADGDGHNEVVVAYSDRLVRCFRWVKSRGDANDSNASDTTPEVLDNIRSGSFVLLATWNLAGQASNILNQYFDVQSSYAIPVTGRNFV